MRPPMKPKRKPIHIPLDIDPRVVTGDHTALTVPRRAFENLHSGWNALREASDRISDDDKLSREAKAHVDKIARIAKADNAGIWATYRSIRQKIDAAITPDKHDLVAPEIRNWLSRQTAPVSAAMKVISDGDKRTLAAILSAPPQLSGLTRQEQEAIRSHAEKVFEPEDYAAAEQLSALGAKHGEYAERFEKEARARIAEWETGDDSAIKEIFKK